MGGWERGCFGDGLGVLASFLGLGEPRAFLKIFMVVVVFLCIGFAGIPLQSEGKGCLYHIPGRVGVSRTIIMAVWSL